MAFELPAHLRPSTAEPTSSSGSATSSSSKDPISTLLAPVLDEPWQSLTGGSIRKHRERVGKEVEQTKRKILKLIVSEYSAVETLLNGTIEATEQTATLHRDLAQLDRKVDGDATASLLPPLLASLKKHHALQDSHAVLTARAALLTLLSDARTAYAALRAAPSLKDAIPRWEACQTLLNREEWRWGVDAASGEKGLSGLRGELEGQLRVEKDRMSEELGGLWEKAVRVEWDDRSREGSVSVRVPQGISLEELRASLEILGAFEPHSRTLIQRLVARLFTPLLAVPAFPSPGSMPALTITTQMESSTPTLRLTAPLLPPPTALTSVQSALAFLDAHLPLPSLTSSLTPLLLPLITATHLQPSLPHLRPSDLPSFVLSAHEWTALDPRLAAFADGLWAAWAKWRRGDVLGNVRHEIFAERGWETFTWDRERVVGEEQPSKQQEQDMETGGDQPGFASGRQEVPSVVIKAEDDAGEDAWGLGAEEEEVATPLPLPPVPIDPTPSPPRPPQAAAEEEEAEEDGWGFDDDNVTPAPAPPSPPPPLPAADDDEDGWGFGDDDDDDTKPPVILKPTAPTREARRLGRASQRRNGSERSPSMGSLQTDEAVLAQTLVVESPGLRAPKSGGMRLGRRKSIDVMNKPEADTTVEPVEADPVPEVEEILPKGPQIIRERLLVTMRAKRVIEALAVVKHEAEELGRVGSNMRNDTQAAASSASAHLAKAGPDVLALARALTPVVHATALGESPARAMMLANEYEWLASQARMVLKGDEGDATVEGERLDALSDRVFEGEVGIQIRSLLDLLNEGSHSFVDMANEKKIKDAELACQRVAFKLGLLAKAWEPVLPLGRHLKALGLLLAAVLQRILSDVLALQDITARESERIASLCRETLQPLESFFVLEPGEPSLVVAHVPNWLKFCYLSELLEASLADLSYLFETGALVDFATDELVSLVRALFSDTTLRARTIDKIVSTGQQGLAAV